jgi:hypothetical protein
LFRRSRISRERSLKIRGSALPERLSPSTNHISDTVAVHGSAVKT